MVAKVLVVSETLDRHPATGISGSPDFEFTLAEGGERAADILMGPGANRIDAVLVDYLMPTMDGLTLLERLQPIRYGPPIVLSLERYSSDIALTAMRLGAFDVISDPSDPVRLSLALRNAARTRHLNREIVSTDIASVANEDVISVSPAMQSVRERCAYAAKTAMPVLIEGEAGTGKKLLGQLIHQSNSRRSKGLVFADSAMALADLQARYESAQGGTLFIDKADHLKPEAQAWLNDCLVQAGPGEALRRTARRPAPRLILSSRERLVDQVINGAFRDDLHNRVNACPIWIPPLRTRPEDVAPLIHHYLPRFAAEIGLPAGVQVRSDVIGLLRAFDWPGNVSQFKTLLFRALTLAESIDLTTADFPSILAADDPQKARARLSGCSPVPNHSPATLQPAPFNDAYQKTSETVAILRHEATNIASGQIFEPEDLQLRPYGVAMLLGEKGELRKINHLEEDAIRFAFDHCDGRISEMARRLGLGRSTLYRKLREYRILPGEQTAA